MRDDILGQGPGKQDTVVVRENNERKKNAKKPSFHDHYRSTSNL